MKIPISHSWERITLPYTSGTHSKNYITIHHGHYHPHQALIGKNYITIHHGHYHPHQALMRSSLPIKNLDLTTQDYMLSQCIESPRYMD